MRVGKKIQEMAVFIEFLAGAGLAIFFHSVLNNAQAAYAIFGIGILLSLATYLLREDIEKTRRDLSSQYHQAHEIAFAMAKVEDRECRQWGEEMVARVKRLIVLLQQGYVPMDETEFYLEGAKCLDNVSKRLKAVDPMTPGWLSRGALLNFYQANLRALERGAAVTRIFVMNREKLADQDTQKILLAQLRDGIDVRIAFRDELPSTGEISGREISGSFDFAIYDDQVATEVYPMPGKYYGRKTSQPANIEMYLRLYELIEHSAHAAVIENETVVLVSEKTRD